MIGFGAIGAATASTSASYSVAAPATQGATDENFLVVQVKPYSVDVATPTSWTKIAEYTNGTIASGADVGSVKVVVFKRIGVTGSATVTLDSTPTFSQGVMFNLTKGLSESWLITYSLASDTTNGANYSATAASSFGAEADDWIVAVTGTNSDGGTVSSGAISATGLTIGSANQRGNFGSSTGDDGRLLVYDAEVTAGTQTAGASFSFSNASASSGVTILIRARVTSASVSVEPLDEFGLKAGYEVIVDGISDYDEFELVRTEVAGRYASEAVRGGARQDIDGRSSAVMVDYEFHFTDKLGNVCVYRDDLSLWKAGVLQDTISSVVYYPEVDRQATSGFEYMKYPVTWIKDVHTPALNQAVSLGELTGFDRSGRILGKYDIIDEKYPVIITDVTSGMTGTFTILVYISPDWTHSYGTANYDYMIRELLDQGSEYYFQGAAPYFSGVEDFYFIVESISYERLTNPNVMNGFPIGKWTVQFTEIERPTTLDIPVGGGTWREVRSTYQTWREVKSANATWLEMFQKLT